jgi:hypothetical protein
MTHGEEYYDWSEEIKELKEDLEEHGIALTTAEINAITKAFEVALDKLQKKYPYYPYAEPKTPEECEKRGGQWINGKCVLPKEHGEFYGQGAVFESEVREKYEKIAECLRTNTKVKEQWTEPIIRGTKELVGHAREFCKIELILEDKPGDTINIATVRDFDLGDFGTYGSPTLADETTTDIIDFDSAAVQEAGVMFYMKQHLTEKADANVVELINQVARRAVLRAEDKKILGDIYNTTNVLELDKSAAGVDFDADWVPEIILEITKAGVEVLPHELVLFISPEMYEALMKDVAGSMGLVFARPDVIHKGILTEFMGVTIRVVSKSMLPDDTVNVYAIAFKKGVPVLAPKRNFLIETEPDIANRRTLTVVTTALAFLLPNPSAAVKIKTQLAP